MVTSWKNFSVSQVNLAESNKSGEAKILLAEIKADIKTLRPGVMEEYLRLAGKDRFIAIGKELGFIQEEVNVAEEDSQGKDPQDKGIEKASAAEVNEIKSIDPGSLTFKIVR